MWSLESGMHKHCRSSNAPLFVAILLSLHAAGRRRKQPLIAFGLVPMAELVNLRLSVKSLVKQRRKRYSNAVGPPVHHRFVVFCAINNTLLCFLCSIRIKKLDCEGHCWHQQPCRFRLALFQLGSWLLNGAWLMCYYTNVIHSLNERWGVEWTAKVICWHHQPCRFRLALFQLRRLRRSLLALFFSHASVD